MSGGRRASHVSAIPQQPVQPDDPILELYFERHTAKNSLVGAVVDHFGRDVGSSPHADHVLRLAVVPMLGVDLFYGALFYHWSMFACLVICVVSAVLHLITWQLLSSSLLAAKLLFMLNWHLSVFAVTWILTKESGMDEMPPVLALLWMVLFDVRWDTPLRAVLVIASSLAFWLLQQTCDGTVRVMRDSIAVDLLATINAWMRPILRVSVVLFCAIFVLWLKMVNHAREAELQREQALVDRIMNGLLPSQIITRLKRGERLIADYQPLAVIMFMDIVGFTQMSSLLPPRRMVDGLAKVFAQVELIVRRYPRVEKIKTIGDAFMCSSGLLGPGVHEDITAVADLALELRDTKFELCYKNDADGAEKSIPIAFRFGMHCGDCIAGVISQERFTYDVFGDTVNTASRMESYSLPNQILVSEEIYVRLGHMFEFQDCGLNDIKGKGLMHTYFLLSRKETPTTTK